MSMQVPTPFPNVATPPISLMMRHKLRLYFIGGTQNGKALKPQASRLLRGMSELIQLNRLTRFDRQSKLFRNIWKPLSDILTAYDVDWILYSDTLTISIEELAEES